MKLKTRFILTPLVILFAAIPVQAQEHVPSEVELMTKRYADAYDSLAKSYYLSTLKKHQNSKQKDFSVEDFDNIPDSVLIQRLNAMHTLVPMTFNSEVRSYIRFYLKYMSRRIDGMLLLSEYYKPLFLNSLDSYGVPPELQYLPIVESALNPMATSRAGAAGLWQFIYSTGVEYGLEVNSIVDERRDPYKSSPAAARLLRNLNHSFGDWTLAIAAYNCGPGTINKAIARSGGKRNFWEIYPYLPSETRGYIPAFIAVNYVMKYYPEHGIKPSKVEAPVRIDTVHLTSDVLLPFVQQFTGVSMEELHSLNPQYRTDYIPASTGNYHISLPNGKAAAFILNQDTIYACSRDSLSRRPIVIEPDKKVVKGKGKSKSHSKSSGTVYHTVKKGETLSSIARKYGLSVAQLKKLNGLKKDSIRVGQRLRVKG